MGETRTEPVFGRRRHEGELTDLGCPTCPGVLEVQEVGKKGYLGFVCRVGHAFSPQTLLESKEDALEDELWSAVARLEELMSVYEDFVGRAASMGQKRLAAAYEERLARARVTVAELRRIAEENRPAAEPETP